MRAFEIGDDVKIIVGWSDFFGLTGKITESMEESTLPFTVVFSDQDGDYSYFDASELELVP